MILSSGTPQKKYKVSDSEKNWGKDLVKRKTLAPQNNWEKEAREKVFNKLAFVGSEGQNYLNNVVFPFISQLLKSQKEEIEKKWRDREIKYHERQIEINKEIIKTHDIAPFEWHGGRIAEAESNIERLNY